MIIYAKRETSVEPEPDGAAALETKACISVLLPVFRPLPLTIATEQPRRAQPLGSPPWRGNRQRVAYSAVESHCNHLAQFCCDIRVLCNHGGDSVTQDAYPFASERTRPDARAPGRFPLGQPANASVATFRCAPSRSSSPLTPTTSMGLHLGPERMAPRSALRRSPRTNGAPSSSAQGAPPVGAFGRRRSATRSPASSSAQLAGPSRPAPGRPASSRPPAPR